MRSPSIKNLAECLRRGGLALALAFALAPAAARAQSQITTGTVQGTIEDETGAVVPGAAVEAKNVETGIARSQTTGEDGRFVFLQLAPGRYTVTVSKSGFATVEQEAFPLTVGQTLNLPLKMKVSGVAEKVTVSAADIPTVDTTKTEASTTLNRRSVENLPVLGRKFEDLLTLTPG